MENQELAIIIPTKNRPSKLNQILESIVSQRVKLSQILIIEGGATSAEKIISTFSDLPISYIKAPCSLTTQRNIGIRALKDKITLVAFFDDDIVFEKDSLRNMMKFWELASQDVGGASFNNISDPYEKPTFFEKIFLVNADKPGRILPSGFQGRLCSLDKTTQVEWLLGGATVWRRKIFNEFMFDEWYSGYARYEDVDFSYKIGRKYKMFVAADAKVKHLASIEDIEFSFSLGKMQVVNRLHFVRKNPNLSILFCYWACFGLFISNALKGLLRCDRRHILKSKGNIAGFLSELMNYGPKRSC